MKTTVTSKSKTNKDTASVGRIAMAVMLVLCMGGWSVASYLTSIHYFTHTDDTYQTSCAINEKVNCQTVARSVFSMFLGVPVSVWGMFAFLLMGALATWGLTSKRLHERWPLGAINALATVAVGSSLVLGYISFFYIGSLCIYCMMTYGISLLLFITSWFTLVHNRSNPYKALLEDIRALLKTPILFTCLVVAGLGATIALIVLYPSYTKKSAFDELPPMPSGETQEGYNWIGAKDPVLTIVEFSDYQCPFCRHAHENMRQLVEKNRDELRLIHRHLPLDKACHPLVQKAFHGSACHFAKAVECAAGQGKFWQMGDAIFAAQERMRPGNVDVVKLATDLELDRLKFEKCMDSDAAMTAIIEDIKEAVELDFGGATPIYLIDGQVFEGAISESIIKKRLERAAEKK